MSMIETDKAPFIREDLGYELRCLLGAATVWRAFQSLGAGFDVVVAMDAAFVHARNLFNFLTRVSQHDICVTEFGAAAVYPSPVYEDWKDALHQHVLHIRGGRHRPNNIVDGQHLNEQVETFAQEILRLWECWEADPDASRYAPAVRAARHQAVEHARNDADGRVHPLFTV